MRLDEWVLSRKWGELTRLQKQTGLSYATLHTLYNGDRVASYDTAKLISAATDNAVTIDELCTRPTKKRSRGRRVTKKPDLRRGQRPNGEV
jgi:hypothetical protein